jgi:hypothetical protein
MGLESAHELVGDSVYVLPHSMRKGFNVMFHQRSNVFDSLTQGRQRDRKYVQAIVKIAAKLITFYHSFEVPVSCRDNPHINAMGLSTSETFEFLLLQNTQELGLQREGYVAKFVKKESTFVRQFKAANFFRDGARKSASLMAKELTFEQVEGNGGTVQLDQRVAAAGTSIVNRVSDQFLPSSGLSLDEHSRIGRCNTLYLL